MRWFITQDSSSPYLSWAASPVEILRFIRDNGPILVDDLLDIADVRRYPTASGVFYRNLGLLRDVGLVETSGESSEAKLQVRRDLNLLQVALDISLTELSLYPSDRSLSVKPLFGIPEKPKFIADVFVAMPFLEEMLPVYEDHILPVVESLGLKAIRADNVFGGGSVVNEIWTLMLGAQIVIADCTGRNPNVFYELGMAHTLGKSTLLLTQDLEDIPFDIRHLRRIEYKFTPRGTKTLEAQLRSAIEWCQPPGDV